MNAGLVREAVPVLATDPEVETGVAAAEAAGRSIAQPPSPRIDAARGGGIARGIANVF
jgi:hypothetical protein